MREIKTPTLHALEFDGLDDFAGSFAGQNDRSRQSVFADAYAEGGLQWFGNDTGADAVRKCREGDLAIAEKSDPLVSKFEAIALETTRRAWADDVCGSIPNVPAFIAGHPLAMRRRIRQESAAAPLRIFVDLFMSAKFTPEQIEKRGAAIMALVRVLSSRRPVELWAGCASERPGKQIIAVRMDTAPMDLARCGYALIHPSFTRRLLFACVRSITTDENIIPPMRRGHAECLAPIFGEGELVVIGGMISDDQLALSDPEKWIAQKIEQLAPVDLAA